MQAILRTCYARPLAVYLAVALIALSAAAGPAEAMYLSPASPTATLSPDRTADLAVLQRALETRTVQQRLTDHGLTTDEAMARLNGLSDEQLHRFAANLDSVQAGGDIVGTVFALVIIAALIIVIIYLLEGKIEIRGK